MDNDVEMVVGFKVVGRGSSCWGGKGDTMGGKGPGLTYTLLLNPSWLSAAEKNQTGTNGATGREAAWLQKSLALEKLLQMTLEKGY